MKICYYLWADWAQLGDSCLRSFVGFNRVAAGTGVVWIGWAVQAVFCTHKSISWVLGQVLLSLSPHGCSMWLAWACSQHGRLKGRWTSYMVPDSEPTCQEAQAEKPFSVLALEVTQCHCCHILLVTLGCPRFNMRGVNTRI